MCGIVGYVGPTEDGTALDVVLEGLRRLEYRGYDSAGVALVTADGLATEKKAGKLVNLRRRSRPHALAPARTASATPAGPPTAAHRRQRPPAPRRRRRPAGPDPQRHHRELRRAEEAELLADGFVFRSETDTEVAAHLLAAAYDRRRPGRGDARGRRPARRRLHPARRARRQPGVVVGARRNSPLVVGRRRGRELPRLGRRGLHQPHPRGGRARPGPGRRDHARRPRSSTSTASPRRARPSTSTGTPRPPRRAATPPFMAKEINEQPQAVADTLLGPHRRRGPPGARRAADREEQLQPIDRIVVIACGTASYAGMVAKYAIEHWCRIPTEVALAHEFRYCDPVVNERTLVVAISQSGETMDTLMAVRHAARARRLVLGDLQHPRLDHPARVRCRALHARRPGDRGRLDQGVPRPDHRLLPARPLPRPAARRIVRRRRRGGAAPSCTTMPAKIEHVLDRMERVREMAALHGRQPRGALPRPPRRLPGRHGGRAQAQGARLHPRRGVRRRRAQARPDRADRAGPAGVRRRPGPGRPRTSCTPRSSRTSRRSGPAARAPWSSPRRATTDVEPFADVVIRMPAVPPLLAPLLAVVPLQVFALRAGHGQGPRRRPAAQPRQVGHGRVTR